MKCKICDKILTGRQRKFCSRKCKNSDTNNKHQNYLAQQKRGIERRKELLDRFGCNCSVCGYSKNIAALEFHHLDEDSKDIALSVRELSNHSMKTIEKELEKCILVCANCHRELHNPHYST